jgi:DnaJ-class molecular chaperone
MTAAETKDCPRCGGRGRYADPARDPLVRVDCELCAGSGRVSADTPDEPPAQEPKHVPFGDRPDH